MDADENKPSSTSEEDYVPFPDPLMGTGEDITPNSDGGILKAIRKEGDDSEEDHPMKGDKVFVHYVGTLEDGTLFDSSHSRHEQFSFTLGQGQVIKAWDVGVATMRRGEIAVLTCKPEYAYGKQRQGKIPSNSTLVFEVELFDWKGEDLTDDHDEGIIRRIVTSGEGYDTPNDESTVQIHLIGCYSGNEFENRDVKFVITEGSDEGIIDGVELAVKKMKKGETARLKVKSQYAYGVLGQVDHNIPGNADVDYEVTLKEFEKAKESWEMDVEEKVVQSEIIKTKGTNYFKQGRYKDAIKQWKKITSYLETESNLVGEQKQQSAAMQLSANLNIAMALLKEHDNNEARNHCDRAIALDPASVKGYFRRGQAHFNMNDFQAARNNFKKVLDLEPNNKAAKNQLTITNQKMKQQQQKERKMYSNMFSRFAEQDEAAKIARERAAGDMEVGVFNGERKENSKQTEAEETKANVGEQLTERTNPKSETAPVEN